MPRQSQFLPVSISNGCVTQDAPVCCTPLVSINEDNVLHTDAPHTSSEESGRVHSMDVEALTPQQAHATGTIFDPAVFDQLMGLFNTKIQGSIIEQVTLEQLTGIRSKGPGSMPTTQAALRQLMVVCYTAVRTYNITAQGPAAEKVNLEQLACAYCAAMYACFAGFAEILQPTPLQATRKRKRPAEHAIMKLYRAEIQCTAFERRALSQLTQVWIPLTRVSLCQLMAACYTAVCTYNVATQGPAAEKVNLEQLAHAYRTAVRVCHASPWDMTCEQADLRQLMVSLYNDTMKGTPAEKEALYRLGDINDEANSRQAFSRPLMIACYAAINMYNIATQGPAAQEVDLDHLVHAYRAAIRICYTSPLDMTCEQADLHQLMIGLYNDTMKGTPIEAYALDNLRSNTKSIPDKRASLPRLMAACHTAIHTYNVATQGPAAHEVDLGHFIHAYRAAIRAYSIQLQDVAREPATLSQHAPEAHTGSIEESGCMDSMDVEALTPQQAYAAGTIFEPAVFDRLMGLFNTKIQGSIIEQVTLEQLTGIRSKAPESMPTTQAALRQLMVVCYTAVRTYNIATQGPAAEKVNLEQLACAYCTAMYACFTGFAEMLQATCGRPAEHPLMNIYRAEIQCTALERRALSQLTQVWIPLTRASLRQLMAACYTAIHTYNVATQGPAAEKVNLEQLAHAYRTAVRVCHASPWDMTCEQADLRQLMVSLYNDTMKGTPDEKEALYRLGDINDEANNRQAFLRPLMIACYAAINMYNIATQGPAAYEVDLGHFIHAYRAAIRICHTSPWDMPCEQVCLLQLMIGLYNDTMKGTSIEAYALDNLKSNTKSIPNKQVSLLRLMIACYAAINMYNIATQGPAAYEVDLGHFIHAYRAAIRAYSIQLQDVAREPATLSQHAPEAHTDSIEESGCIDSMDVEALTPQQAYTSEQDTATKPTGIHGAPAPLITANSRRRVSQGYGMQYMYGGPTMPMHYMPSMIPGIPQINYVPSIVPLITASHQRVSQGYGIPLYVYGPSAQQMDSRPVGIVDEHEETSGLMHAVPSSPNIVHASSESQLRPDSIDQSSCSVTAEHACIPEPPATQFTNASASNGTCVDIHN